MEYLASIIIPTRNREKYCVQTVKQILEATGKNIQIVVQDNSDSDVLEQQIPALNSSRVVYHHDKGVLSFVENFNRAVSLAQGKYLCMIGDDDGVLSNFEQVCRIAEQGNYEAVIPGLNAVYFWPGNGSTLQETENGYLMISDVWNRCKEVNVADNFQKLISWAFMDYQSLDLPRLYHGIIEKKVLDEIYDQMGYYFGGLTPDMYIVIALCTKVKRALRLSYPVTISGICAGSGSSRSASGEHTGELKDAPHFKGHDSYEWIETVPYVYSVETIWAETALQAMKNFGYGTDKNSFNLPHLEGVLWKKYPQFHERLEAHASKFGISKMQLKVNALLSSLPNFVNRIKRLTRRRPGGRKKYYMVKNISEAYEIAMKDINITYEK